jgi:hypothetical protein
MENLDVAEGCRTESGDRSMKYYARDGGMHYHIKNCLMVKDPMYTYKLVRDTKGLIPCICVRKVKE